MRWCAFFMVFVVLLVTACTPDTPAAAPKINAKPYFDLKGYFEEQIKNLSASQPKVSKKVSLSGKLEELTPDTLDYAQELRSFADADINKPAWLDKYAIDSLKDATGSLQTLRYKALAEDLKIKLIEVNFNQNIPERIYIAKKLNTAVANSEQELVYMPGKGYKLTNKQQAAYSTADLIGVEVNWQ